MQQPLLILNWKMNPETLKEAKVLKTETQKQAKKIKGNVVLVPPAIFLSELAKGAEGIAYAAQNIHEEVGGSHTGDISTKQAKSVGARYALIGHAERRALDDTDERVQKKVAAAITAGLQAIICIGEKVRDENGTYLDVVRSQLREAVASVTKQKLKQVIIAYEPVWAIGKEKPMSTHEMHEMSIFIRKVLSELYGKQGMSVPVLYGGSIEADSAVHMMREGDVQGLLVGRASVDVEKLRALLKALQSI